jgi:hypothetical protein
MRRVIKYDGLMPMKKNAEGKIEQAGVSDVSVIKDYVDKHRTLTMPFDIVVEGATADASDTTQVRQWSDAGATWWIESLWGKEKEAVLKRLRQGPPR